MHVVNADGRLHIKFTLPPFGMQETPKTPFERALERFVQADPRWGLLLDLVAAVLTDAGREAFAASLDLLEAGPAPSLMPTEIEPDGKLALSREAQLMAKATLTAIGAIVPTFVGFGSPEIAKVQGYVTAVHRLLRIAKARP